ncbi:NAD(P)/FAD-dependent oxidoreductase [Pseudonocardia asaccharolytica]|uniref:NADH:ubiquinone reductase (non-electrogenic) n=1 Tax=Pseudonocardia asaccharolytica DSM 44247 = NBRC 16224 TaxID=1123024 RepID=A0A511D1E1_9PSEU|nr:NAD(P)/FAD-dependent oxidoreductase [Pseudonocardia asaccharolytica]GEL17364.1 6-phosphogluconate dehydrogenase [Pseudonocardia asaccharolytica DSM 44247 = NBRC 16224]
MGTDQAPRGPRPQVIVVGAGFAGMAAVRELRDVDVDVLLLDRDPFNTFQPLLYQVATGGVNPGDITYSLRAFAARFPNTRFRRAAVTGVDTARRRVRLDSGADVGYDYLILCCGVTANFFGIPGAEENARTIYSRRAAIGVRDRVLSNLESVAQGRDGAVEPVVVVVGGGATGVEMAGALAELRNTGLPLAYPELDPQRARVVLVEMADDVLAPFEPGLRRYAADALRERGVDLRLGVAVKEVRRDCVVLSDGECVPSAVTIWATGVRAHDRVSAWGLRQGRGGRIQVEPDMRVVGHSDVFAVGDVAAKVDGAEPQLAQPAIQGGRHAARQIRRLLEGKPTEPFRYRDKGIMATIGRSDAVVQLPGRVRLRGFVAWAGWLGLHILALMSNRNRLATMANLAVRYLTWKRTANVIMGDPP